MSLPTTGKFCEKLYRCQECGHEKKQGTNHWGEVYSIPGYNECPACPPYKRPNTWVCGEEPPAGMGKPTPWKKAKIEIKIMKKKKAAK